MLPLPVILESQDDMSVVDGATIEPRIRINRPDDENTRCRGSSVRGQPKDFSQLTQPPTTLSTSNAFSLLQARTEPFARRLGTCGARQSRSFENIRDAEFSCSSFNDVTTALRSRQKPDFIANRRRRCGNGGKPSSLIRK